MDEPREHLIAYGFLYGGFNTRRCTLVHSFFFKLFSIGCIGLIVPLTISPVGLLDGLQFTLPGYKTLGQTTLTLCSTELIV